MISLIMSIEFASHNVKVQLANYYTTMWYLSARQACLATPSPQKNKKRSNCKYNRVVVSQERIIEARDQGFSIRFPDGLTFVVIS